MLTMKLDHLVYFTQNDVQSIVNEQRAKGNPAVVGGKHEDWGTENALLYADNVYIEWLTVEDEDKARIAAEEQPLIAQYFHDRPYGDGWATVCFSVEDMEQWKDELDNKGFTTTKILKASRKTENGELLRWKMLFIEQSVSNELPYPFFIEWEEPEAKRQARLAKTGARTTFHQQQKISECIFHVEDPLRESGEWAILLSQKVGDVHDIQIGGVVLRFIEKNGTAQRLAEIHYTSND
ncbi:VOC family protein [Sporosarcina ureae]|nr:VOC family protein [Sporosarcina ureae]